MTLENLILDEAEQCYDRLVEAYAAKCINDIPYNAESSSYICEVPYIQNEISGENRNFTKLQDISVDNDNNTPSLEIKAVFELFNHFLLTAEHMIESFRTAGNESS